MERGREEEDEGERRRAHFCRSMEGRFWAAGVFERGHCGRDERGWGMAT